MCVERRCVVGKIVGHCVLVTAMRKLFAKKTRALKSRLLFIRLNIRLSYCVYNRPAGRIIFMQLFIICLFVLARQEMCRIIDDNGMTCERGLTLTLYQLTCIDPQFVGQRYYEWTTYVCAATLHAERTNRNAARTRSTYWPENRKRKHRHV